MLESILAYFTPTLLSYAGASIGAIVLGWFLKKINFDWVGKKFEDIGRKQGIFVTTFFAKKLPKLWNGVIEPIFIKTIHAIFFAWERGFIDGLRSDNTEEENKKSE